MYERVEMYTVNRNPEETVGLMESVDLCDGWRQSKECRQPLPADRQARQEEDISEIESQRVES